MKKSSTLALYILGALLVIGSLFAVRFLCTDMRLKPAIRAEIELGSVTEPANDDMALLLQMLNEGGAAQ